jgi:predicted DNA-binding protein
MTRRKQKKPLPESTPNKNRTCTSSVSLPVQLWADIKALAVARNRTHSFVIREWVEQGIAK